MRVLVTGACGMLGRLVVSALQGRHAPIAADILEGCEQIDVADPASVFDKMNRFRPEMVIHCAAMTDVDGCETDPDSAYRVNAVGTWNVACAAASMDCAVAYVSTDYVFDGTSGRPYTEFDMPNPLGVYGASKLAGEQAVRELCRRHYIVRTSWLFAPHGRNFARTIADAAKKRAASGETDTPLKVVADQVGSPTYARDLAEFLASLPGSPLCGTYHYTNAGSCSWHEFAAEIVRAAGLMQVQVLPIRSDEWPTPTRRPEYSVLRHYRMELLGRDTARPWQEAVAEFVSEWTTAKQ